MAYNTGLYTSVAKLLSEMAKAGTLDSKNLVLSAKALDAGTVYSYTFAPATPPPAVGDFLVQGDIVALIVDVTGAVLKADMGASLTSIDNGKAKSIFFDGDLNELQDYILQAMAFIDRHTRQWFNARTFDDSKPVLMEGNNSQVLFFPVPILEITAIRKEEGSEILDPLFYQVFNGRDFPDDRRNPMIKLRQEDDDVLFVSSGKWMRGVRAVITGIFGFLEADGSTPLMIQRATLKLALIYASKSLGEQAASAAEGSEVGPIKREKTDLHEIEYFDARAGSKDGGNDGTGLSGDDYIDDVIAAYKGPIIIGGTFPDIGVEAPVIWSWTRDGETR